MATKAEAQHADTQRRGPTAKTRKRARARKTTSEKGGTSHESKRAAEKATYALEPTGPVGQRPSRKSTRASANRSKPDANLKRREDRAKRAPTNRLRKARAAASRVRGAPAP